MIKIMWSQTDIFNLLRERGLTGLLETERDLRKETDGVILSPDTKAAAEESLSLIHQEIESKLKKTGTLFIIYSNETNLPFIDCLDTKKMFVAYVFTDRNSAETYADKLEANFYHVSVQEIVTGKKRQSYFDFLMDKGVNFLSINPDTLNYVLSIRIFSKWMPDGFRGLEYRMKNSKINALLSGYVQDSAAGKLTKGFQRAVFLALKNGWFIFPIVKNGVVNKIDHSELAFNYMVFSSTDSNGIHCNIAPFFTDEDFCCDWRSQRDELHEQAVCSFDKVFDFINDYNVKCFILNYGTHNLELSGETVTKIKLQH